MKWKLREWRSINEPYPYLVILCRSEGGFETHGHERYRDRETAIYRAKWLTERGQKVSVVKDVASSYRVEHGN